MRQVFLNHPADVQWLQETALKGVPCLPAFRSFVLIGNEDGPDELHLYDSPDPLYSDGFVRVRFDKSAPVYCTIETVKGK